MEGLPPPRTSDALSALPTEASGGKVGVPAKADPLNTARFLRSVFMSTAPSLGHLALGTALADPAPSVPAATSSQGLAPFPSDGTEGEASTPGYTGAFSALSAASDVGFVGEMRASAEDWRICLHPLGEKKVRPRAAAGR